jgi:uncharacterized protein YcaQ
LIDDQLVGRIEPVVDRENNPLKIVQIWWEKKVRPSTLIEPLARGISRMSKSLGTQGVVLGMISLPAFRSSIEREMRKLEK